MIARRGLLALLGGLPFMSMPMRPDQVYDPPIGTLAPSSQTGIFRKISIGTTVILSPSNDKTGVLDAQNVQHFLNNGFSVQLAAGTFYANATVLAHENQYVTGAGNGTQAGGAAAGSVGTLWVLTATGIPAFQWESISSSTYQVAAAGGVSGVTIVGVSSTVCPTDGSIGVQMADIPHLHCDVFVINCQFGLLCSNTNWFTEQGNFTIFSQGNTNPVILQTAAAGGPNRTGSFARTWVTVYHNDTVSGSFGLGGVQLLAGAVLAGGGIRQYGNFSGTGQANTWALRVSGVAPIGPTGHSTIIGAELVNHLEYGGSGTAIGSIFVDTLCSVTFCTGVLDYLNMSGASITGSGTGTTGFTSFTGGIFGDNSLVQALWQTINSGFPAGFSGTVEYARTVTSHYMVTIALRLQVAAGTTISSGQVITNIAAGYRPTVTRRFIVNGSPNVASDFAAFLHIDPSGDLTWHGSAFTVGAGDTLVLFADLDFSSQI